MMTTSNVTKIPFEEGPKEASSGLIGLFDSLTHLWNSSNPDPTKRRRTLSVKPDQELNGNEPRPLQNDQQLINMHCQNVNYNVNDDIEDDEDVDGYQDECSQARNDPTTILSFDSYRSVKSTCTTRDTSPRMANRYNLDLSKRNHSQLLTPKDFYERLQMMKSSLENSLHPVIAVQPWLKLIYFMLGLIEIKQQTYIIYSLTKDQIHEMLKLCSDVSHLSDTLTVRQLFHRFVLCIPELSPLHHDCVTKFCVDPDGSQIIAGVFSTPLFLQFARVYMRLTYCPDTQATFLANFKRFYLLQAVTQLVSIQSHKYESHTLHALNSVFQIFSKRYTSILQEEKIANLCDTKQLTESTPSPKLFPDNLIELIRLIIKRFDQLEVKQLKPMVLSLIDQQTPKIDYVNIKKEAMQKFLHQIQRSRTMSLTFDDLCKEVSQLQEMIRSLCVISDLHRSLTTAIPLLDPLLIKSVDHAKTAVTEFSRSYFVSDNRHQNKVNCNGLKSHLCDLYTTFIDIELSLIDAGFTAFEDFLVTSTVSLVALQLLCDKPYDLPEVASPQEQQNLEFENKDAEVGVINSTAPINVKMTATEEKGGSQSDYSDPVKRDISIQRRRRRGRPSSTKSKSNGEGEYSTSSDENYHQNNIMSEDDSIQYRNGVPQSGRRGVIWHQAGRAWDATWAATGKQHHKLFYVKELGMRGALEAAIRFRHHIEQVQTLRRQDTPRPSVPS